MKKGEGGSRSGPSARGRETAGRKSSARSAMADWMAREHPKWLAPEVWKEWYDRCALGRCAPPTQEALMDFTAFHFHRFARRYAYRTNVAAAGSALSARESWHLFETHLTVRPTREGQRYKDWLFARVPPGAPEPMRAVVGGAVLLLRDAVRQYLACEFAPATVISLNSPVPGVGSGALYLEDLLPDFCNPADNVARREYETLALQHAETWFAVLGIRERVVLLARHLGIPLNHPQVQQLSGWKKSRACTALRQLVEDLARDLRREYPEDPSDALRLLGVLTLGALNQQIQRWAEQDPRCIELMRLALSHEKIAAG